MKATVQAQQADTAPLGVVLVTGMSGAGKSSALHALEDLGYEAVDNLPLALLNDLLAADRANSRPLAVGVDIRTRDFAASAFVSHLSALRTNPALSVRVLFVDCDDEVLRRRYSATRRRHPMAQDRPVTDGIARERVLVSPLRAHADLVVDTTVLSTGSLRAMLGERFSLATGSAMQVAVISFAFGFGLPREADLVLDVRFLANPHYEEALSPLDGRDRAVGAFIERDPDFAAFFERACALLEPLLPRYEREGKSYLTLAIGCTGGRHRSVFVTERLAKWLSARGRTPLVVHRDLERSA
jgi:RNase adapter protein RapZ